MSRGDVVGGEMLEGAPAAWNDEDGMHYSVMDVSGMLPLYQQIYERILTSRLRLAGLGGDLATVTRSGGRLITSGPRDAMRAREPSAVARRRAEAADMGWVEDLDQRWRRAAAGLEEAARRCWQRLCEGQIPPEQLHALVSAKVSFSAFAVDSLLPEVAVVEAWLAPHVGQDLAADVIDACYLPGSGSVAYDVFEDECWLLASSVVVTGLLPEAARRRFVRRGLFFLYDALDTDRRSYYFHDYPRELAAHYSQLAAGPDEIGLRREEIRQRSWRRRLHHAWGRQQIEAIGDGTARRQLLVVHRLLGSGRDFDEEKRRLNTDFWRCLVTLAGALDVSLTGPEGTLEGLSAALTARDGRVVIDPVFPEDG